VLPNLAPNLRLRFLGAQSAALPINGTSMNGGNDEGTESTGSGEPSMLKAMFSMPFCKAVATKRQR
jgi:hypothetical protein